MVVQKIVAVVAGAVIGGVIGYFGRCSGGMCMLTSNPWSAMVIGAVMGYLIAP